MRLLVAHKRSRFETLILRENNSAIQELIDQGDVSVINYKASHERHIRSLELVCEHLASEDIAFDADFRGDLEERDIEQDYDLVITVGGDGTVLDLSHKLLQTPILAVNSDPVSSVGYFCACTARDFPRTLADTFLQGHEPIQLHRFYIRINDQICSVPVLNEALIAHSNPAAVSRYILRIDEHEEEQKSSGIWVATPAGSTAAIRSAGGFILPLGSRNIQYLVREPYPPPQGAYRLTKGIRPYEQNFEIISKMQHGNVYLDGPHLTYPFGVGDHLHVDHGAPPLRIYGLDTQRRAF